MQKKKDVQTCRTSFFFEWYQFFFLDESDCCAYTIPIVARKTARKEFKKGYSAPRMNS